MLIIGVVCINYKNKENLYRIILSWILTSVHMKKLTAGNGLFIGYDRTCDRTDKCG
jgi:hypothetical protein